MTMTCLRCSGKGTVPDALRGGRTLCGRCKGKTVVDGNMEREQRGNIAANKRRQVVLTSGIIGRLTFWAPIGEDRVIVKVFDHSVQKTKTLTLTKSNIKEIL